MLNKSELRLGNYYYDTTREKVIKFELKHFRYLGIDEVGFMKRYEPISITPTSLMDFGFSFTEQSVGSFENIIDTISYKKGLPDGMVYTYSFRKDSLLKYIHQLQNRMIENGGDLYYREDFAWEPMMNHPMSRMYFHGVDPYKNVNLDMTFDN